MCGHICVCSASWGNLLSRLGLHTTPLPCTAILFRCVKWSADSQMELSSSDDDDDDGCSGTGALENTQRQPRVARAGRMNNEWRRLCLVKSIVFIRYNGPLHLNNRIYMRLAPEPVICRKSAFFSRRFLWVTGQSALQEAVWGKGIRWE